MSKVTKLLKKTGIELREAQRVILLNGSIGENEVLQDHFPLAAKFGIIDNDVLDTYAEELAALLEGIGDSQEFTLGSFVGDLDSDERLLVLNEAIVALSPEHCSLDKGPVENLNTIVHGAQMHLMQLLVETGGDIQAAQGKLEKDTSKGGM